MQHTQEQESVWEKKNFILEYFNKNTTEFQRKSKLFKFPAGNLVLCCSTEQNTNTVNQLLFVCEKMLQDSLEPHPVNISCHKPFLECLTWAWKRLNRKNYSLWTSSSWIDREIKLLWIKVGCQFLIAMICSLSNVSLMIA